ncbi:hypothetical protein H6B15_03825 [Gemmiger formicilis]|uniref:hypothetical protein n=1 Tax=Gemmiger formicilis TaxID=745368 RepID=UPI001959064C|nr:hypothetical protein [Gemmiger formicilis]MBM6715789.1 hypothetical protein [Gemmiger formicilis]
MKDWDFGYFGKGIDGYVHYMQAFHRNFPKSSKHSEAKRVEQKPHNVHPREEGGLAAEPGRTGRAVHDHCDSSRYFVAHAVTEQKGNQDANDFD